jgi:type VI secretion system protein ImpK
MAELLAPGILEVLVAGMNLRDRVVTGNRPHLGTEQGKLKALLNGLDRGTARVDQSLGAQDRTEGDFLGVRYALVCWLDETMIEAGWREWDENKLEQSLYRTNMRYSNFWQQARLAEADPSGSESQTGFLLCVLLGFRGELGETPERLREWVSTSKARITKSLGKEPAALPEKAPISDVPPLVGIEKYRQMTKRLVAAVLIAVPLLAFLVLALLR